MTSYRIHAPVASAIRRFRSSTSRLFALATLLVVGSLAPWSDAQAFIATCNLANQSANPVAVREFDQVTVTFDVVDQGNCASAGGMPYTINIINGSTSGTLVSPAATGTMAPGTQSITVQGSSVNGNFQLSIACQSNCSTTGSLTWTVNVENVGLAYSDPVSGATSAVVGNPLNLEVYWGGPTIPVSGDTISWTVISEPAAGATSLAPATGPTDPGGLASTTFTGAVAGTYNIQASAGGGCTFCSPTTRTFTITVAAPDADTGISISDAPDPVDQAGSITYTINAFNAGPDTAAPASWTDTLPASLVFTSVSAPAGWTCSDPGVGNNGIVSCSTAGMTSGASDNFTLVTAVTGSPAGGSTISNSVSITSTTPDSVPTNQNASTTTTVANVYTLAINGASSFNLGPGESAAVSVDYLLNGSPAALDTAWVSSDSSGLSVSSPVAATGTHTNNFNAAGTPENPGTYTVTVSGLCPSVDPGCVAPPDVVYTVVVEDAVMSVASPADNSTVLINTPQTITADFRGPTRPVSDGTNIGFSILSEPSIGAGSFSFAGVSSVGGTASSDFTGTVPGTYLLQVCDAWDGCLGDSATVTVVVVSPSMTVAKSLTGNTDPDGSGTVTEGDVLTYQVVATNDGSSALTNVAVSDTLVTPNSANCASVAVGLTCTLTGTYTVTLADVSATQVTNSGSATSNEVAGPISDTVVTPVATTPELTVAKSLVNADGDGSGTVTEGDVLAYTVSATNTGNIGLTNVTVSDPLISPTPMACAALAVGASCDLSGPYTVTAADVSNGSIDNTGTGNASELAASVSDTLSTPVAGSPALTVAKTLDSFTDADGSTSVTEGDTLFFTVAATNSGNVLLTGVDVSDPQLSPASISCPSVGLTGTCDLSGSYVVTAADASAGSFSNTGAATSTEAPGPFPSNTVVTPVAGSPALSAVKTFDGFTDNDGSSSITEGDALNYTVTATNAGNVVLNNVAINDAQTLPASASCPSVAVGGTCVLSGAHTVTAADVTTGSVTNTASADSDETLASSSNTVVTPVAGSPALSAAKTFDGFTDNDGSSSITEGDALNYTVTATNAGNVVLNNVAINDAQTLPASASCPSVAVGGTCVLSGAHTVTAADVTTGSVTNTASADSDETLASNSNTVVTPVAGTAVLSVAKSMTGNADGDGSGTPTEGDVLTYTINAFNAGNVVLTNVNVSDPMLTPNTASCATLAVTLSCDLVGTYTITAADIAAGIITNTGSATSSEVTTPVTATHNQVTVGNPALTVNKALAGNADGDGSGDISPGDVLTFSVDATNSGNIDLTNVNVADALTTPSSTTCATLAVGATCTLVGTYTVTAGDASAGTINNIGTGTATEVSGSVNDALSTPVASAPALTLAKSITNNDDPDASSSVTAGDTLTYTVSATNAGNVPLTNVVVSDPLITPNSSTCANVAIGASCDLVGNYTVTGADAAAATLDNTASATATEVPGPTTTTLSTPVFVVPAPNMDVVKALVGNSDPDGSGTVTEGDVLTYDVAARNIGNTTLTNVQVDDPQLTAPLTICSGISPGSSCVLTGTHVVTRNEALAGQVVNTGSAQSTEVPGPVPSNTVTTAVIGTPALTVVKTYDGFGDADGSTTVSQGDTLNYTVTASNTGTAPLTNVVVTDAQLTPGVANCANVPAGSSCVLAGTHVVTGADVAAGNVTNTASADSSETAPAASNTVVTPISGVPALAIAKTFDGFVDGDGSGSVSLGDTLNYTVTATNTGSTLLSGVSVSDVQLTPNAASCATVAIGATCVLGGNHVVSAADVAAGNVTNTASADSNETAPANSNTVVTAVLSPGLVVAKTFDGYTDNDGSTTITGGDVLDYTVTATNSGNSTLTGVTVTDAQITPNSANCASVAVGATCVLAGSHSVTNADVLAGNVSNTATADSNETGPQSSNTINTAIAGSPSLSVAKVRTGITDNDGSVTVTQGDAINYAITATNDGNVALTNVVVSDPQITPASNTCASVAVGATCVLTGSHVITAGDAGTGTVTNTASADSNETAPANSNTVVTAVLNPGLVVAKTFDGYTDNDGSTTITGGDVLDYTVTATNTGNSTLTGVTVTDAQITPNSANCGSVAVGATCVLAGSHTVTNADVLAGNVSNTAAADANETTPQSSNTINTAIAGSPSLSVAKVRTGITDNDGSMSVTQGDAINYAITATNDGNVALTNVVVSDPQITPASTTCANVAVGATCVLTGSHVITAGDVTTGTVSNTASVDSNETAPENSNTVVTAILGSPAVALVKTFDSFLDNDGSTTITLGDTLEYTLTASNTGNVALTGVIVGDPLLTPASANCASVPVGGTCVLSGTHVVTGADVAAGNVTNTGTVTTDQTGTTSSNTLVATVNGTPGLTAAKTFDGFTDNDGTGGISAGDTLGYTVVATNGGTVALTNVVVSDALLAPSSTTCANVAIGATCTLTGTHVVTGAEVAAGNVTNTASATSTQTGPVSSNTVVTPVAGTPVLSITSGNGQSGLTSTVADNPLVVTLVDGSGIPIAGQLITWTATGAGTVAPTSTLTDASGIAQVDLTFAATAGPVSITASTGGGANSVNFTATAQSGGIVGAGGNNQTGPVNTTLPVPLKVRVLDPVPAGNPGRVGAQALDGVPVTFTVASGGGSVAPVVVVTDVNGEAATQFTLGPIPGIQTVTASIAGGASFTFSATATIARTLAIVSGDGQSAAPGSALPSPLVVHAQDNGTDVGGVDILWTLEPGSVPATITPSGATSAAGIASATVVVGATTGPVTIRATRADDPTVFVLFNANTAKLQDIPGLSPEERELAIVLDEACEALAAMNTLTPAQADLLARCQELIDSSIIDPGATQDALEALLPGLASAMAEASFNAAQAQFQNLKARIAALRSGTQGNGFNGLALNGSNGAVSLGALGQALTQDGTPTPSSAETGSGFQRWGFFASGTIGRGEAEAGSTRPAYDYDINGLTAGIDYRYSDSFIFGGALGYTRQDTELQGAPGKMDMSGWSISGYATWYRDNSWFTDAVVTWGSNQFDLLRTITYTVPLPGGGSSTVSQQARSNSDGSLLEAAFTFGRDFQAGGWSIGPYGRVLYTKLDFDRIADEMGSGPGSGLGLEIDARSLTSLASEIGAKFTYAHSTDWGVVTPHLQLEWEHEFKDDPKALTARFLADPNSTPFTLEGEEIDTDYFRMSLGLSIIMSRGRSGFLIYERTLGRSGFTQENLGFGLRIEF